MILTSAFWHDIVTVKKVYELVETYAIDKRLYPFTKRLAKAVNEC